MFRPCTQVSLHSYHHWHDIPLASCYALHNVPKQYFDVYRIHLPQVVHCCRFLNINGAHDLVRLCGSVVL